MAYSQGGLIEATDYNNLINGFLNLVWGVGDGNAGYGQTAISAVTAGTVVTAAQWATLINTLNSARTHQTGSGSGISAVTAGQTINHLSTLSSQVGLAYNDRLLFNTQGTTTTGTTFTRLVTSTTGLSTWQVIETAVTFSSADSARYFFNAGGQLNYRVTFNSGNGSGSTQSLQRLLTGIGGINLLQTTNSGRTGSGITLDINNTTIGYYDLRKDLLLTVVEVTDSTTSYTGSNGILQVYSQDGTTTNNSKGFIVVFRLLYDINDKTWDDTISLNITPRVDIVSPSTTNLTNSWGTPRDEYYWTDIFNRFNRGQATGNNCNLSADTGTAGPYSNSTPMLMAQTGNDPHTNTYNNPESNLAAAASGQTWRVTVWMRASSATQAEGAWIAEANSSGSYLAGGGSPFPNLTTSWQQVVTTYTTTNASCAFVQVRLDGTNTGGSGINIWWDLLTIERIS
jgi:hypothetical protein